MPARDRTVADWIAEGEATIVIDCCPPDGPGCGHAATIRLDTLDPRMTRSRLCRQAVCAGCGKRGGSVMRDMAAHYERLKATGWGCDPFAGTRREKGAPAEAEAPGAEAGESG